MRIQCLQHVPFEGPGYIKKWTKKKGHKLSSTRLYNAEELPQPKELDMLVVMGGPMGVHGVEEYPWLAEEKKFIKVCIKQKKKIVGICLGAQLIADVLGAKVKAMPGKEIGWFPLKWSREARVYSFFDSLPAQQSVLHWHGDTFDLPDDAVLLASSEGCKNQAFLIADYVLGLQFHLEMTEEGLSALIKQSYNPDEKGHFIQSANEMITSPYFERNHKILETILDRFIS